MMASRGLLLSVPLLFSLSCVLHGPGDLKRELSDSAGVELDKEFGMTLGRTSTWLARKVVKWSGETDISLKGVRKVEIGVYEVKGLRPGLEARQRLELSDLPDWNPIVHVHDDGEDVFVLIKEREDQIRGLLVVVAEEDEWVLVRIRGKLNQIVEDAMRMAFDEADRPDLYERTREERGLDLANPDDPQAAQALPLIYAQCTWPG